LIQENEGNKFYDEGDEAQVGIALQNRIPEEQEIEKMQEMLLKMPTPSRGSDGLRAYDPATAPQPNAFSYRVTEDDAFFPNKKWNCGDTDCCKLRPPGPMVLPQEAAKCEACPCVEPIEPGVSPNATISIKRLLM